MAKKKAAKVAKAKNVSVKKNSKQSSSVLKKSKISSKVKKVPIEREFTPIVKKEEHPRPLKPKVLQQCRKDKAFVLSDGGELRSLVHLIDALENMSDGVFSHHVNEERNDFSTWLKDVFKEEIIADELQLINDRLETQRALLKHSVRSFMEGVGKR